MVGHRHINSTKFKPEIFVETKKTQFYHSLHKIESPSGKQTDDEMLSESELKSRREALLAQLDMSMDE